MILRRLNSFPTSGSLILSFILLTCGVSFCQNEYRFERLTVSNGLSQSVVTSVIQDHFGYLWVGTLDGLNRYNGQEFKIYRHQESNPKSIPTNYIGNLFLDRKKQLWITFRGVITLYNPVSDSFENFPLALSGEESSNIIIHDINAQDDGTLLLATNRGFVSFDQATTKFHRPTEYEPFATLSISKHYYSPEIGEWIISRNEVQAKLPGQQQWTVVLKDSTGISGYFDQPNNAVFLQTTKELLQFDLSSQKLIVIDQYKDEEFDLSHFGLIRRTSGEVWVFRRSIYIYNKDLSRKTILRHVPQNPFSISGNHLSCLYESADGVVWVGTSGFGLNKFNPNLAAFNYVGAFYGAPISLYDNYVSTVFSADDVKILVAPISGLDIIDLSKNESKHLEITTANGLPTRINKFIQGEGSRVWLCTDRGFKYLENDKVFPSGIPALDSASISIFDFVELGNHTFALTTGRAVYLWNSQTNSATKISPFGSEPIGLFDGKIWIESSRDVKLIDQQSFKVVKTYSKKSAKDSLSRAPIKCFYTDRDGQLWIGSWGAGLGLFDPSNETFINFNEKNGLPNLVIYGILEDDNGHLWLSTNSGISVFDKKAKKVIRTFDSWDGLQGNEFNTRAYFKSASGLFYFGGVNGLSYFNPSQVLNIKPPVPQAVLKGFYINHQRADQLKGGKVISNYGNQKIELSWDERNFDFEIAGLNYTLASRTRFKYILENYDESWNDIGNRSIISFTNLPAGKYTLRVKAYNTQGISQKDELIIELTINGPIWKNQYFLGSVFVGFIVLGVALYWIRTNTLRKSADKLKKMVLDRTREIQTKNEEIATQNEEITSQNETLSGQSAVLSRQNHELAQIKASLEHKVEERTTALKDLNKKLLDQNSQLEQFAFITAHNIRGPVARIKGLIDLLPKTESVEMGYLLKSINDLDELILDLNTILNVQYNTNQVLEPVNLLSLLKQIISSLDEEVQKKKAIINLTDFKDTYMLGVKSYLHSIFYNLLHNALKYSDPARQLIIKCSCQEDDKNLVIKVEDTGLGIDMRYTEGKIFHMYQRFHPEINGKGLGLFLIRSQIEAMSGKIEVRSEIGKGTAFHITFTK